jgi:acetyltransferase-like isoleucine patch superfamily enzyme
VNYLLRRLVVLGFYILISLTYKAYSIEGINALLLLMPAKLIVPVLRRYGATIGEGAQIHSPLIVHNASPEPGRHYANLVIGNHCYVGRDVLFDLRQRITFEDYVTVSMRCTLLTHTDAGQRPPAHMLPALPASCAPISIHSGAYLGANTTVLQGVTVGANAIVAAGALVRCDVAAETTVGGVPARRISQ